MDGVSKPAVLLGATIRRIHEEPLKVAWREGGNKDNLACRSEWAEHEQVVRLGTQTVGSKHSEDRENRRYASNCTIAVQLSESESAREN